MTLTYDNRSAAYDLNMFKDSTAKKLPKKKTEQQAEKAPKNKVVSLPQDEIVKIRRRKHNPFKLFIGAVMSVAVTFAVAVIIIGQVQLTELNRLFLRRNMSLLSCNAAGFTYLVARIA